MSSAQNKNQTLVFNKFIRKYKDALTKLQMGQLISTKDLHAILAYFGYVDQFINDQSLELCHTIAFMLSSNKNYLITKGNLFQFLTIITDVKKGHSHEFYQQTHLLKQDVNSQDIKEPLVCIRIGNFNTKGEWTLTADEENQVKTVFGFMNLKRISRHNIEAQQKDIKGCSESQTFKPQILDKSRQLAQKRYKKISLSNSKVEERLIGSQSLQKSKLQVEARKSVQKEMKQCPFKPKINRKSVSIVNSSLCKFVDSMNNSFENKQASALMCNNNTNSNDHSSYDSVNSKTQSGCYSSLLGYRSAMMAGKVGDKLLSKGKQYEERLSRLTDQYRQMNEEMQMKQCTFQPKLCYNKSFTSHKTKPQLSSNKENQPSNNNASCSRKSVGVRNAQKSIQRMKQARKKRQFENQVKERGYPQNVAWTKFMNSNKMGENQSNADNKTPILCIDLKIMESTKNISVFHGQSLQQISQTICLSNSVPQQFWPKVQNLLKMSIQQCNQVKIQNNKIYLNRG